MDTSETNEVNITAHKIFKDTYMYAGWTEEMFDSLLEKINSEKSKMIEAKKKFIMTMEQNEEDKEAFIGEDLYIK